MRGLNATLASSDQMRDRVGDAVDRLRERRNEHEVIDDGGNPPGGGPDRVKCLHAHLAHELSDPPNPVGALVLAQVGFPDCRRPCVELES